MIYLVLSALLFTVAILLATTAARHADASAAAFLSALLSIVVPLLLVAPKFAKHSLGGQHYGMAMAALSGVVVGAYIVTLTKALAVNKVGIVTPVIYGGTIVLTTILSYFIYKEKITLLEGVGLSLVIVGLVFIMYARARA